MRKTCRIILTYRNFGDISLNGVDGHFTYYINRHWNLSGNYSYYSKNFFAQSQRQPHDIALNAPTHKFGLILDYRNSRLGIDGNLRLRFIDGFPVNSGVFIGKVDRYTVLDLNVGYNLPFSQNTRLSLTVQNLTDDRHQEVVGAPKIGRLTMLRLMQSF